MIAKFRFKGSQSREAEARKTSAAVLEPSQKLARNFIISVGGNLAMAGVLFRALFSPTANAYFITKTGIWLFMVEFLSIL